MWAVAPISILNDFSCWCQRRGVTGLDFRKNPKEDGGKAGLDYSVDWWLLSGTESCDSGRARPASAWRPSDTTRHH